MNSAELSNLRRSTADQAYQDFEFDEGCAPEAADGWEDDGLGNFTKAIYIANPDDADGATLKGVFNVAFDAGSVVPDSVWATLDGNDIGRKPASGTSVPRL
jgi:hypothetical protein